MGNRDDWIADDGGFDFEEFQEDMSFASDIAGVHQRKEQINELREVKSLLKQQQAEAQRKKRLPKCPECGSPLEKGVRRCVGCRMQMAWLDYFDSKNATKIPLAVATLSEELPRLSLEVSTNQMKFLTEYKQILLTLQAELPRLHDELKRTHGSLGKASKNLASYRWSKVSAAADHRKATEKSDHLSDQAQWGCIGYALAGFLIAIAVGVIIGNNGVDPGPEIVAAIFFGFPVLAVTYYFAKRFKSVSKLRNSASKQLKEIEATPKWMSQAERLDKIGKAAHRLRSVCLEFQETLANIVSLAESNNISIPNSPSIIRPELGRKMDPISSMNPESVATLKTCLRELKLAGSSSVQKSRSDEKITRKYWVKRGVTVKGPLTIESQDRLRKMLEAGKLRKSDQIAKSKDGPWNTLESILS
jgi:hypothetical protein